MAKEIFGAEKGKIRCKNCNHWIGVVGTQWLHFEERRRKLEELDFEGKRWIITHAKKCWCGCTMPEPK